MEKKLDLILQKLEVLDEMKEIVMALRDSQEVTDAKLEALTVDVHKLHGIVTNHTEILDRITKGQERQEKILETLALRSIEQESELRDLKRVK